MGNDLGLRLALDPGTGELAAAYTPAGDEAATAPAWDDLAAAAQAQGWGAEVLDHARVAAFLALCRDAMQPVSAPVGAVHDGSLRVDLEPDNMSALLTLVPPRGGRPIALPDIYAALALQEIIAGIDDDAIRQAVQQGHCDDLPIARGTPPLPGTPTRFVYLVESPLARVHDDNAPVDYRQLGNLVLVEPGTPLVRREAAVPGVAGQDVLGQLVVPELLPDLPFSQGLNGVQVDEHDPCLLRAAVAGAPMMLPQGAQVNSVVEVAAVDLDSGNVDFDGTLRVKGDITAGMTVRVGGDVIVAGTVEAAHIQAGGSLTVNGGIIGMGEPGAGEPADGVRSARVQCAGSVKARFIEHADIQAGQQVSVEREIRHSRILAGHSVMVGPPGSQQGVALGGEICALHSVRAGTLGSMAGVPTLVRVGLDPHADAQRAALRAQRQSLDEETAKLEQVLAFLQSHPDKAGGGVGERARNTYDKLRADLASLDQQEAELERRLQPLESAFIAAGKRFYSGVTLQVGAKVDTLLEDYPGGRAGLQAGQLLIR
ncbi:FapA family protein [Bordetella petrii]|uniref:FapA family protein n=1 Tax=Bordetella petrii TaxID=94624 RepID=UPI001E2B6220|nr:FapA family protein [Bordetella petrii]MCD0505332.1 FapA family protein [Bordetella petrii]